MFRLSARRFSLVWRAVFGRELMKLASLPREFDRFEPKMNAQRRQELYAGWQAAVRKTRSGTEARR